MNPRIPITDKRFRYVNAASTDVRKTWSRARTEMLKQRRELLGLPECEVVPLKGRR